jgi:hypothetical protein
MPTECDRSQIKGGWNIGLASGNLIDLTKISESDIDFQSIFQSLSMQCRFGGHVKFHYSVAQHSVYVCDMIAHETQRTGRAAFAGLIHDFSEGFTQDLVRGIKVGILDATPAYSQIEHYVQMAIARAAGLHDYEGYHEIVKKWDNRVLKSEVLALNTPCAEWMAMLENLEAAPISISPWNPSVARQELEIRFNSYRSLLQKGIL